MDSFAAFIVTFERAEILPATIQKLLEQTIVPKKILVIDNSESNSTRDLVKGMDDTRVQYHRMGYNAGPAGGAWTGLQMLANDGFDWIFWGDDNDPPRTSTTFEEIFRLLDASQIEIDQIGIVGSMGSKFNRWTFKTKKIRNTELKPITAVDCVPGGGMIIVHRPVVVNGILPDPNLFFGFEELDFCLRVGREFKIVVNGELFLKFRQAAGKDGMTDGVIPGILKKTQRGRTFSREYYSLRNLIYISLFKSRSVVGFFMVMARATLKLLSLMLVNPKAGYGYSKIYFTAVAHGLFRKMGKKLSL